MTRSKLLLQTNLNCRQSRMQVGLRYHGSTYGIPSTLSAWIGICKNWSGHTAIHIWISNALEHWRILTLTLRPYVDSMNQNLGGSSTTCFRDATWSLFSATSAAERSSLGPRGIHGLIPLSLLADECDLFCVVRLNQVPLTDLISLSLFRVPSLRPAKVVPAAPLLQTPTVGLDGTSCPELSGLHLH